VIREKVGEPLISPLYGIPLKLPYCMLLVNSTVTSNEPDQKFSKNEFVWSTTNFGFTERKTVEKIATTK
jgi:hypothetical protein